MYVVANRVRVAAGWEEKFEHRFQQRTGQIDQQPGFVRMDVLRPDTPETPYVVLTVWHDKSAFEQWIGSDDFRAAHSNPMPPEAFDGDSRLERYETVVSSTSA